MSALLHLIWISLKGLVIFAVVLPTMVGTTMLMFGKHPNADAIPGIMGGGILLFVLMFGGLYVVLGGRI